MSSPPRKTGAWLAFIASCIGILSFLTGASSLPELLSRWFSAPAVAHSTNLRNAFGLEFSVLSFLLLSLLLLALSFTVGKSLSALLPPIDTSAVFRGLLAAGIFASSLYAHFVLLVLFGVDPPIAAYISGDSNPLIIVGLYLTFFAAPATLILVQVSSLFPLADFFSGLLESMKNDSEHCSQ